MSRLLSKNRGNGNSLNYGSRKDERTFCAANLQNLPKRGNYRDGGIPVNASPPRNLSKSIENNIVADRRTVADSNLQRQPVRTVASLRHPRRQRAIATFIVICLIILNLQLACQADEQDFADSPPPLSLLQLVPAWAGDRTAEPAPVGSTLEKVPDDAWPADGFPLPRLWIQALHETARYPLNVFRETGNRYVRGRIRVWQPGDRSAYDLVRDLRADPAAYQHRPVTMSGYLMEFSQLPADSNPAETAVYQGKIRLYHRNEAAKAADESVTVNVLTTRPIDSKEIPPEGLPVLVSGYLQGYQTETPVEKDLPPEEAQANALPAEMPVAWWLIAPGIEVLSTTLPEGLLEEVRNRTKLVKAAENDAYYRTLLNARLLSDAAIQAAARKQMAAREPERLEKRRSVYVDVFKRPDDYRGELVTLEGTARKSLKYRATIDRRSVGDVYSLGDLYELWVFPDEGQGHPAVIVFTEKPAGLELGDNIDQRVRFTGYFFKLYGYDTTNKTLLAPMFLGKSVTVLPPTNTGGFPVEWVVGGLGVIIACWLLFAVTSRRRRDPLANIPDELKIDATGNPEIKDDDDDTPDFSGLPTNGENA